MITSLVLFFRSLTPAGKAVLFGMLAAIILLSVGAYFTHSIKQLETEARVQGVNQERAEAAGEALKNLETARDATVQINIEAARGSGDLMYAQCVRSARTPANCQRFLPGGSADLDRASTTQGR